MTISRPVLGSLAAAFAALGIGAAATATASGEDAVATLVALSEQSNAALMRGDSAAYMKLVQFADDFTLMSPFGGPPSRGPEYTPERIRRMGAFFRNGSLKQEMIGSYASRDLVVLALIERSNVEVGGLPPQDWALRVTLVYRRDGAGWKLVHRHADPLVDPVHLTQSAALARGERHSPKDAR